MHETEENPARWIEPETADALLAKLKNLHAQTERHDELLGVYETLRDNERYFREMIDALPAAIYTTDAKGRLTHFNPAAVRLSGRTPELGTDQWCVSWRLFRPDGTPLPHSECPMAIALKEGHVVSGAEIVAERPDGSRVWLNAYPTTLRGAQGQITGGINMLVDITERKRAEAALRESEERFRVLADNMSQFAWTADSAGWIFWYNQRWYDYTGTTLEEMEGWGWQKVHHPEHVARVVKKIKRCFEAGEVWEDTFPLRGKDGEYRWFLSRALPIRDAAGKVVRWLGTNTDITEQRNLEESLRAREADYKNLAAYLEDQIRARTRELEERNAEILDQTEQLRLLSNRLMQSQDDERRRIARELHDSAGQYLAALGMSLEAVRRGATEMPPKVAEKLDEATEIVEKCSSEIRTLSHLLHPPLLEELGLASAIEWYVEGFASRSDIEVKLQIPPKLPRLDEPIELALFRVLQECLTNIHRHSGSKTAIVKVETDEHRVNLEVIDEGKGIPKPVLDTQFVPSKRLGVGINGMRERLKGLGGTLEIQSTNLGTTARAAIPLRADARAATSA